jgi:hypothetical protein
MWENKTPRNMIIVYNKLKATFFVTKTSRKRVGEWN